MEGDWTGGRAAWGSLGADARAWRTECTAEDSGPGRQVCSRGLSPSEQGVRLETKAGEEA